MALNIISNFAANVAHRNLTASDSEATSSVAKLSAGKRVLSAKDDAASLAIGSRLRTEVAGLKQAGVNAGQASSMLQIADGAMDKVNDILTRMKTLSIQSGSGQLSATERGMLDTEFQSLKAEINRIAEDTEFNGTKLVDGHLTASASNGFVAAGSGGVAAISAYNLNEMFTNVGVSTPEVQLELTYGTGNQTFEVRAAGASSTLLYSGSIVADDITHLGGTSYELNTGTVVELTAVDGATVNNEEVTGSITLQLDSSFTVDASTAAFQDEEIRFTPSAGGVGAELSFKVGTGTDSTSDEISVNVQSVSADAFGLGDTVDITTQENADVASMLIGNAIDNLQVTRANVGASQNRLDFAAANIATSQENQEAARSQLMDLDVAAEMSKFTSKQILVQAGTSMLAQANQLPQNLLSLFR
jgi:flagellin